MVVWLRHSKDGIAIPDGVIRRSSWLTVESLDSAFCAIEEMRCKTLAAAEQEAQTIIETAHQQAAEIRHEAQSRAQELFEQARESGCQDGVEEWNRIAVKAARESHQQIRQQRERMARIVIAAVEKIVPLQDSQGIYRQVLRILEKSMQAVRYVTIRVCPDEVISAESALKELAQGSPLAKVIEVKGDERLTTGACLVESDQGIIDLSLDSQLRALRAAIFLAVGEPPALSAATATQADSLTDA